MKRPAASSGSAAAKKKAKKLPEGDQGGEVREHLFSAGGLFPNEQYDGPQKFTLVAPGTAKFKNAKPLELYYFAIRALGQLPQLCCEFAGYPYVYTVMLVPHFQANMKADLEFGRLPMVRTADNKEIVQSKAVLRYVAAHVGLAGKSASDAASCDMWYEMLQTEGKFDDEALRKLHKMDTLPELNGDLKSISRRATLELSEEQKAGNALKFWDNVIGKSRSGFIMPFMTYVDIALWWALRPYNYTKQWAEEWAAECPRDASGNLFPSLLQKCGCTKLIDFMSKIGKQPGIMRMVRDERIMPDTGPDYKYRHDLLITEDGGSCW